MYLYLRQQPDGELCRGCIRSSKYVQALVLGQVWTELFFCSAAVKQHIVLLLSPLPGTYSRHILDQRICSEIRRQRQPLHYAFATQRQHVAACTCPAQHGRCQVRSRIARTPHEQHSWLTIAYQACHLSVGRYFKQSVVLARCCAVCPRQQHDVILGQKQQVAIAYILPRFKNIHENSMTTGPGCGFVGCNLTGRIVTALRLHRTLYTVSSVLPTDSYAHTTYGQHGQVCVR